MIDLKNKIKVEDVKRVASWIQGLTEIPILGLIYKFDSKTKTDVQKERLLMIKHILRAAHVKIPIYIYSKTVRNTFDMEKLVLESLLEVYRSGFNVIALKLTMPNLLDSLVEWKELTSLVSQQKFNLKLK